MADRGDRFRRLRTPGTGDLFEHFGVIAQIDPRPGPAPTAIAAATPCRGCGWYRPAPLVGPCPLCGSLEQGPKAKPTSETEAKPAGGSAR